MRTETVTTILAAPRDAVFAYMAEIENLPAWATEFARELRRLEAERCQGSSVQGGTG